MGLRCTQYVRHSALTRHYYLNTAHKTLTFIVLQSTSLYASGPLPVGWIEICEVLPFPFFDDIMTSFMLLSTRRLDKNVQCLITGGARAAIYLGATPYYQYLVLTVVALFLVVPPKYSLKGFILEVCCRDWSLISVLV